MTDSEKLDQIIERLTRLEERFLAHIREERRSERRWTWAIGILVTIALGSWGILSH